MSLYFAYGANIDPARMSVRIPGAVTVGPAYLDQYGVEFTIRDREWGGGVLNIRPNPGSHVWGMLYDVPDEQFAVLDTGQGDASMFGTEHVTVHGPQGPVNAVTYRVVRVENHVRATDAYLRHITQAMADQGLPDEAVEAVRDADRFGRSSSGPSIVS